MSGDVRSAQQIAALFHGPSGAIWDLVETSRPQRTADVVIRDARGLLVVYARRADA